MNTKFLALTGLAALVLTACGGGSDDHGSNDTSTTTPAPATTTPPVTTPPATTQPTITASAEGVYEGTYANGLTHLTLVTDTSRMYSILGTTTGGVFAISRFLEGLGTSTNGAFTATEVREYGTGASTASGTFTGTYVPGTSLNGTLALGGANIAITGAPLSNTTYVYNTPAKLANITGAWTLNDLNGARVTLLVEADGKFTGTSGTCAITGSLTPKSTGKNVFTFSVTSGPAPCPRPNDVSTGVAVEFTIGTARQLIAAASGVTRVNGTGWVGAR